ncbi:MAG: TonB-dependent receptor [Burkholderiales bacterium]|nr:TonB-dependent receptor [Burkholderiales bacterium]
MSARVAAGVLLAIACAAAAAQEDAVTVSATRLERPTLEVPASVDRVDAETIRWARPQVNLSESLARVPGLSIQNRHNYAQDLQMTSRGFGARSTFGIRGLRLVADGIPASFPDGQGQVSHFDLGSAERIEVLRGPFSAMHGNAAGGVVQIFTERGSPGVSAELLAGGFDTLREALKLGGETWVVSASRFRTGGWREHSAAVREHLNARATLSAGAETRLALVANAFASPEAKDPMGLTRAEMQADPRQVSAAALAFDTRKSQAQTQLGASLEHRLSPSATLHGAIYLGERRVRQFLGFAGDAPATASGGVVDLDRGYGGASLRLAVRGSLGGAPLVLQAGGEYERMADRRRGFVNAAGQPGALRRDEDNIVAAAGAYAQAEWRFAERWIALAGVRASRVAFRLEDFFVAPGNPDDTGSRAYRAVTPTAGLLYRASPTVSLYANYGRGFETPTFTELAYRAGGTGLNFALEAARSRHVEAGAKAVLGAGTRLNAAVFEVATDREIVVDTNVGGRTTYKNAGRTRRSGAELSVESALGAGFEATLAWTVLDATFRDTFTGGTPAVTVRAGNVLPGVAPRTLYAELRWRHEPSGFAASLEVLHRGRVAVNDTNTDFAEPYTVANLAAGFTQQGAKWKLTEYVRIENAGDRRYVGSVIVNAAGGRFFEPAPRRAAMVGLQATLAF